MKDALTGGIIGLVAGMVVGGIVVAKNKKTRNITKINRHQQIFCATILSVNLG